MNDAEAPGNPAAEFGAGATRKVVVHRGGRDVLTIALPADSVVKIDHEVLDTPEPVAVGLDLERAVSFRTAGMFRLTFAVDAQGDELAVIVHDREHFELAPAPDFAGRGLQWKITKLGELSSYWPPTAATAVELAAREPRRFRTARAHVLRVGGEDGDRAELLFPANTIVGIAPVQKPVRAVVVATDGLTITSRESLEAMLAALHGRGAESGQGAW